MRSKTVSGTIMYRDRLGHCYRICRIDQITFESEEFRYEFRPDYGTIDILPPEFDGIPGLDLSLRRECYVRENIVPVFIAERVPPRNRENLSEELEEVGLGYYDALEWLIRTDTQYFGDRLYVERFREADDTPYVLDAGTKDVTDRCRGTMQALCDGREIVYEGDRTMSVADRKVLAGFLRTVLGDGVASGPKNGRAGRRPSEVDPFNLEEVCIKISKGKMTVEQGSE
ncbi:MAG: hypothetical protein MJZ68_08845, partial [archaeon]|nr:hypothetical protein [archaeon]